MNWRINNRRSKASSGSRFMLFPQQTLRFVANLSLGRPWWRASIIMNEPLPFLRTRLTQWDKKTFLDALGCNYWREALLNWIVHDCCTNVHVLFYWNKNSEISEKNILSLGPMHRITWRVGAYLFKKSRKHTCTKWMCIVRGYNYEPHYRSWSDMIGSLARYVISPI
jgi:hypothetical protein